jgi:uncharacterized membrane protein YfcA
VQFLQNADWPAIFVSIVAVLFIGISKAGFGGALGLLSTPLCVLAFGPRDAIGILLPLLCAGDAFSLYPYWRKWDSRNLKFLLPGVVAGVLIGVQLIGRFSARELNIAIGCIAVAFVVFQVAKDLILRAGRAFVPGHGLGVPFGIAAGITSTFAHGAGPVVTMFLVPQRLPKEIFVGTMVLIFTWVNWIKMPFFVGSSIINRGTMELSLLYLPLIPLGVWFGVRMNRTLNESSFLWIIYAVTLLAGLQLIFDFDLRRVLQTPLESNPARSASVQAPSSLGVTRYFKLADRWSSVSRQTTAPLGNTSADSLSSPSNTRTLAASVGAWPTSNTCSTSGSARNQASNRFWVASLDSTSTCLSLLADTAPQQFNTASAVSQARTSGLEYARSKTTPASSRNRPIRRACFHPRGESGLAASSAPARASACRKK